MNVQPIMLPQGWEARWDAPSGQYVYYNQETGQTQWEVPTKAAFPSGQPGVGQPSTSPPPQAGHGKRRLYPTQQMAEVYGTGQQQQQAGYMGGAVDGYQQQQPQGGAYPQQAAAGGPQAPQFFTPGMDGSQQPAQFQAPQQPYGQPGVGGVPGQPGQPGVDQMASQFQNMNVGAQPGFGGQQGGYVEKQLHPVNTVNLIGLQPDVRQLDNPPPPPLLPANASVTNSPHIYVDPSYQRCTLSSVPQTSSLLNKSKLPFALVMSPNRSFRESDGDEPVPVVSDNVIARCRRCRAYINPYVTFIEGGNRWKCCLCGLSNEVPQLFDWDRKENKQADRWMRSELNHAVVDFVASQEYHTRPPSPLTYCFIIDVSQQAIQSGMVATAARAILESLDGIPDTKDNKRTKIAFIAVSTSLHFFSLPPGEDAEATMLVVSDLNDVFLPKPVDLLVNLHESRPAIENLLGKLNDMFADTHTVGNALGSALQGAFDLVSHLGGKIVVLSSSLPTLGTGALKPRDDPKLLGTSKESQLLQPASPFYKTFAIECSKSHVSVDIFLFSASYTDVATLSCLPRYTAGQTYLYPGFNAARPEDAIKFATEFGKVLTSDVGLEGVFRVRATRGLRTSAYHGNFMMRASDLLMMPVATQDQSYVIELQIEDDIRTPFVILQTAWLYTSCYGERRIRVITLALPTTDNMAQLYASADQQAIMAYFANKAVEKVIGGWTLEDARNLITKQLSDMLTVYKNQVAGSAGASAQLAVPTNLALLPLLACGLVKHVGLREGSGIPPDLRAYAQDLLTTLPVQALIPYIHARFYSLHNMPAEAGEIGEQGVVLPPPLNLTSERLERHGLFLIEDGQNMFLWVGQEAVPRLIQDVFDLPSYADLQGGKYTLPELDNPFSKRVNAIIAKTRELRRGVYRPHLYVVKSDAEPALRSWALSLLIEDRMDQMSSYAQYLTRIKSKVGSS